MAKIFLIANLNCDRVLHLDKPIHLGGRFLYQDHGQRLGGGGSNTGISLAYAGHKVSLMSEVGKDHLGDWLINQASEHDIDCTYISRHKHQTNELILMVTPDGERTIVRPHRPTFELRLPVEWPQWDALYINTSAQGASSWCKSALNHCLVVAQLGKDERSRPCHVLIASATDMLGRSHLACWEYGKQIAGDSLKYFVVTNGEHGATVYFEKGEQRVPAFKTKVIDATGAGDAYAAGLIHGLTTNLSIIDSMKEAAHWAACAVASETSIPGQQLKDYLKNNDKNR
ncbi:PfkB family carbohydrate kinase [Parashewanella tropica]|uniref:PfkB family carbohydrate kinase n=1 Tax=Parashewanella tropica TaxID=2547970 RepID=UPI001059904E|nr:PfkB family carbohydrate kinase [Parashewanella tropica]